MGLSVYTLFVDAAAQNFAGEHPEVFLLFIPFLADTVTMVLKSRPLKTIFRPLPNRMPPARHPPQQKRPAGWHRWARQMVRT